MGILDITLRGGDRKPFRGGTCRVLVRDTNNRTLVDRFLSGNALRVNGVPSGGPGTAVVAIASAPHCHQIGVGPWRVEKNETRPVPMMLIRKDAEFDFSFQNWDDFVLADSNVARWIGSGNPTNANRFASMITTRPVPMACLFNITESLYWLGKKVDTDLLSMIHGMELRDGDAVGRFGIKNDRFFAFADRALLDILGGRTDLFSTSDPGLHPGADLSFKEMRFDVANLQFTFATGRTQRLTTPDGTRDLVSVEFDMDYYRDRVLHFFGEVVPNSITHSQTEAAKVYALRWTAGGEIGEKFEPLYTLTLE